MYNQSNNNPESIWSYENNKKLINNWYLFEQWRDTAWLEMIWNNIIVMIV